MTTKTLAAMFIAMLFVAGCGTSKAEEEHAKEARAKTVEAHTKEVEAHTKEVEVQKLQAEGQTCSGQVDALIKAEAHLNGRLGVGLSFVTYSEQLSNVSVAYEEVPFKKMSLNCLNATIGAEKALNAFKKRIRCGRPAIRHPNALTRQSIPSCKQNGRRRKRNTTAQRKGLKNCPKGSRQVRARGGVCPLTSPNSCSDHPADTSAKRLRRKAA